MAIKLAGYTTANLLEVESNKSARTCIVPRGNAYAVSTTTGTMGAALTGNAAFFAMRLDPSATVSAYIDRIMFKWSTVVAFTTPVTATRRIVVTRGAGASPSGGSQITAIARKSSSSADSECQPSQGGECRVSTTGALTVTGITFEGADFASLSLVHVGAAGAYVENVWEFDASAPLILAPGEVLALRNGASAMDAAGTWVGNMTIEWREAAAM